MDKEQLKEIWFGFLAAVSLLAILALLIMTVGIFGLAVGSVLYNVFMLLF